MVFGNKNKKFLFGGILILATVGFFFFVEIAQAVHTKYTDSGLPCEQTSGEVLCLKRFDDYHGVMNVVFKIPKEISGQFPPDPMGICSNFSEYCPIIVYNMGKDLLRDNCLGGHIITERKSVMVGTVELFYKMECKTTGCKKNAGKYFYGSSDFKVSSKETTSFNNLAVQDCPTLDSVSSLSVSSQQVEEDGSYTVSWSSSNPRVSCALSGKMPDDYSASSVSGSNTFFNVPRGIYTHKFTCRGILDGANSSAVGEVTKTAIVKAGDIAPSPIVTLKVEPASIKKGENATLSWTGKNAASISINQGIGIVRPSGSIKVSPDFTTRYTISVSGEFPEQGLMSQSVTVKVVAPEIKRGEAPEEVPEEKPVEIKPPVEKLKVDLRINGQKGPLTMSAPAIFNISWNLDKYCLTYGSWLGIKTKAGEERQTQTKPGTYTYNMYCPTIGTDSVEVKIIGGGGQASQAAVPLPVAEASISADNISFSNKIRVIRGEPTDIWLSAGYDVTGDRRASQDDSGKWAAMSNGGQCQFNYDLNQGAPSFEAAIDDPETAKTCTVPLGKLTFYDKPGVYRYGILRLIQGDNKVSNVSYVTIVVQEPPPPETPPIIDFRINNLEGPSLALGAPAEYTVSWNVANADTCQASDSWEGNKFMAGSEKFVSSEKKEFVYTLSCTGKLGTTVKSINLKVAELPVCDFSAEPAILNKKSVFEQQSVLAWKCKFANTCLISPDIGIKVETFGSARVSPKITTSYNLTCANLEGSASFVQTVEVK